MAFSWYAFPPALAWGWIGAGWYLGMMAIYPRRELGTPPWFSWGLGLTLLVGAILAMGVSLGPITLYLFYLPVLVGIKSIIKYRRELPRRTPRLALGLAILCPVLMIISAFNTFPERWAATPGDIIVKWEGTALSRQMQNQINRMPLSEGLPEARKVISQAFNELLWAAPYMAKNGEPGIDVPLMINALERMDKNNNMNWQRDELVSSLSSLSGLTLTRTAKADEWRKAWAEAGGSPRASSTGALDSMPVTVKSLREAGVENVSARNARLEFTLAPNEHKAIWFMDSQDDPELMIIELLPGPDPSGNGVYHWRYRIRGPAATSLAMGLHMTGRYKREHAFESKRYNVRISGLGNEDGTASMTVEFFVNR